MVVVRLFILLVLLVLGAGCPSPLPVLDDGGDSSGDTENSSGNTGAEADDTGADPVCGNGLVEVGENCDDAGRSATCDIDCTPVTCGDGVVNDVAGEECEGEELAGGNCEILGFDAGTLHIPEHLGRRTDGPGQADRGIWATGAKRPSSVSWG